MPIYEFYCADCHAVFNFLARKPDTKKRPKCPRCGRPKLDRKVSRFAISKGRSEPGEGDNLPADFDQDDLEQVVRLVECGFIHLTQSIRDKLLFDEAVQTFNTLRDNPGQLLGALFVYDTPKSVNQKSNGYET